MSDSIYLYPLTSSDLNRDIILDMMVHDIKKFKQTNLLDGNILKNFYELSSMNNPMIKGIAEILKLKNNKAYINYLYLYYPFTNVFYAKKDILKQIIEILKTKYKNVEVDEKVLFDTKIILSDTGEIEFKTVNILSEEDE